MDERDESHSVATVTVRDVNTLPLTHLSTIEHLFLSLSLSLSLSVSNAHTYTHTCTHTHTHTPTDTHTIESNQRETRRSGDESHSRLFSCTSEWLCGINAIPSVTYTLIYKHTTRRIQTNINTCN